MRSATKRTRLATAAFTLFAFVASIVSPATADVPYVTQGPTAVTTGNSLTMFNLSGQTSCSVWVTGAGVVTPQISSDGLTWFNVAAITPAGASEATIAAGTSGTSTITSYPYFRGQASGGTANITIFCGSGGAGIAASGGGAGTNVNIASVGGNPVTTTVPVSGTVTTVPSGTQNVNQLQLGGATLGAATAAGTSASGNIQGIQGVTGGIAVPVSGSVSVLNFPATQVVSGTVTANAGTGTFTVGGSTGTLVQTANGLKVDGSAVTQPVSGTVAVSNFPATQPVSGTVSATQGTTPWTVGGSTGTLTQTANGLAVDGSAVTQPVSGTVTANAGTGTFTVGGTVTANAGTGYPSVSAAGTSGTSLITVQGSASGVAIPISGTVTTTPSGTQNVNQLQMAGTALGAPTAAGTSASGNIQGVQGVTGGLALPTNLTLINGTTIGSPTAVGTGQTVGNILNVQLPEASNADGRAALSAGAVNIDAYNGASWDRIRASAPGTSVTTSGVLGVQGVTGGVALPVSGTVTATVTQPYSGTSDGQTATASSVVGIGAFNGTTYDRVRVSAPGTSVTTAGVLGVQGVTGGVPLITTGSGTAGTPAAGVVSIQGITNGTLVNTTTLDTSTTGSLAVGTIGNNVQETLGAGQGTVGVYLTGASASTTFGYEGSVDGTNFVTISCVNPNTGTVSNTTTSGSLPLVLQCNTSGFLKFGIFVTAAGTGGPVTVTLQNTTSGGAITLANSIPAGAATIGAVTTGATSNADGTAGSANNGYNIKGYNGTTWDRIRTSTVGTSIAGGSVGALGVQGITGGVALPVSGTVTATVSQPYSGTSDAQTATAASVVGIGTFNGTTYDRLRSSAPGTSVTTAGVLGIQGVTGGVAVPVSQSGTVNVTGVGTAGTPATGVQTIQGIAGGTAVPVSGSVSVSNFPATQPVSGTVTANAGTGFPSATAAGTSGTSLTTIQGSASGVPIPISGSITASVTFPYSGTSDGQTATTASVVGLGAYNGTTYDRLRASAPGTSVTTSGVLGVQGVTGGVPLPISGTVTTTPSGTQTVTGAVTTYSNSGGPAAAIACDNFAAVNITASGENEVVALASGQIIHICGYQLQASGASTSFQFAYGTGTNCSTGASGMTGSFTAGTSGGPLTFTFGTGLGALMATAASNALCINASGAAISITGVITYSQF